MNNVQKVIVSLTALYAAFVFSVYQQGSEGLKGDLSFFSTAATQKVMEDAFVEQYFTVNMARAFMGLKELYTRITVHTAAPEIFGESDFDMFDRSGLPVILDVDTTSTMTPYPSGQVPAEMELVPARTPEAVKDAVIRALPQTTTVTPILQPSYTFPTYGAASSLGSYTYPIYTPPVQSVSSAWNYTTFPSYPTISSQSYSYPSYTIPVTYPSSAASSTMYILTTSTPHYAAPPATGGSSSNNNGCNDVCDAGCTAYNPQKCQCKSDTCANAQCSGYNEIGCGCKVMGSCYSPSCPTYSELTCECPMNPCASKQCPGWSKALCG